MGALTSGSAAPAVVATRSRDLVNVGYPNNDSFFYLLHDVDGKAEAQCVGEARGVVTANWIDPPAAGVSNVWDAKRHRRRLTGGRWSACRRKFAACLWRQSLCWCCLPLQP